MRKSAWFLTLKSESSVFITRWSRPERGWLHFEAGAGESGEFGGPLKLTCLFPLGAFFCWGDLRF